MKKIKNIFATSLILSAACVASLAYANSNPAGSLTTADVIPAIVSTPIADMQNAKAAEPLVAKAQDTSAIETEVAALIRDNKLEQALNRLDAALLNQPDPNLNFQKGVVLSLLNRVDDAITVFNKMTELYPNIAEPYNNLGILYVTKKDLLRARSAFEMAVQNRPDYINAQDNLGDLYVKLAANLYQKNLSLDANNMVASSKLNLLNPITSLTIGSRKVITADGTQQNTLPNSSNAPVTKPATKIANKSIPAASNTVNTDKVDVKSEVKPESKVALKTEIKATKNTDSKTSTPLNAEQSSVLNAVNNWAKSWSQKNIVAYLGAYSDSFKPGNMSLTDWKIKRKEKIANKGHIKVILNNPDVVINQQQAVVNFIQNYESDKLKNVSKKTLVLVKKSGTWLIEKEMTQ